MDNYEKNLFTSFVESTRLLQSSKITERKNQVSKLTNFLDDKRLLILLDDQNELSRKALVDPSIRSRFDWNNLFAAIKEFMIVELNSIKDKKTNIESKVLVIRGLLNLFLNQVNSRGSNNFSFIEFYEILTFFFENEDEHSGAHKILNDLSNFFLNSIISNHGYCCQMEKPHWLNLINVYTTSFLNHQLSLNSTLDPVTCLKCLRMIMNKIRVYVGSFNLSKLHSFFHLSIYNLKKEFNTDITESLLGAILASCTNYMSECLFEICKLGEEIVPKLLELFRHKEATQYVKETALQVIEIQVFLHKKITKSSQWLNILNFVLDTLLDELKTISFEKYFSNVKVKKLSGPKYEQLSALEALCSDLVAKCLIEVISNKERSLGAQSLDKNVLSERNENSFENSRTNKRARLEAEWSWQQVLGELKDEKDISKQVTWISIVRHLISGDFDSIPGVCFDKIFNYVVGQIDEINLNSASLGSTDRKTLTIGRNIDSDTFQTFYFRLFYQLAKGLTQSLEQRLNANRINKVLTKTAYFFLRYVNKDGKFCTILTDILDLGYELDQSIFELLVDKFSGLLATYNIIQLDTSLVKLMTRALALKSASLIVTDEMRASLIDKVLVSFKDLIHKPKDMENSENQIVATQVQEANSMGFLIQSLSNLKKSQNYIHVAKLLEGLVGIGASTSSSDSCETSGNQLTSLLFGQVCKKDQFEQANKVYEPKLMSNEDSIAKQEEAVKSVYRFNSSLLNQLAQRLLERADSLIHLASSRALAANLVQIFIEEYFLNLVLVSSLLEAGVALGETQLNQLLQGAKSLFGFISNYTSQLVEDMSTSSGSMDLISFILTEFYLSLAKVFSRNQFKIYVLLYTVDVELFENCYSLIDNQESTVDSDRSKINAINLNECLKTILLEADISLVDLNKHTTQLERLKLMAMALVSTISVQCLNLSQLKENFKVVNAQTDSEVYERFQRFGESLKKNLYGLIFSTYFGSTAEKSTSIKREALLQTSSHLYHSLNLMIFLDAFSQNECSMLSFNEYRFSLTIIDTIFRSRAFQITADSILSPLMLQIFCNYGGFLLMLSSFCTFHNRLYNEETIPNGSFMLDKCQDKYTELIDLIEKHQGEFNFQSPVAQLNLASLLATSLKIYRLKIIGSMDDKKLKKKLAKKMTEKFDSLLVFLSCKSNCLKCQVQEVLVTSAFDRYLMRVWLYRFLKHGEHLKRNLYANKSQNEFADLEEGLHYLVFLANEEANKQESVVLLNDEFENLFFDKFYQSLAEKHSLFEAASEVMNDSNIIDIGNSSIYQTQVVSLSQRSTTNSLFEEKYSQSKKMYASIRKYCDDAFYLKLQTLSFIEQLLSYQHRIRNRKCEIKCLFALVHLHAANGSFFDLNSILQLINSFEHAEESNFLNTHKSELFHQWLEINYDSDESILGAINQFPYDLFGYDSQLDFIKDCIPQLLSFYCLKNTEGGTLDRAQITELFKLWLKCNPNLSMESTDYDLILGSDSKFGIEFYSNLLLSLFLNSDINQKTRIQLIKDTSSHRLITPQGFKKHFHFIFIQLFTCPKQMCCFSPLDHSLEQLVMNLSRVLLDILSAHAHKADSSEKKLFLQLIQNCCPEDPTLTPKHLAESALYRLAYRTLQNVFEQKSNADFLHSLQLGAILLKNFLFSVNSEKEQESFSLLSVICTNNNYQICLHHYVLFKMSDLVKVCRDKLQKVSVDRSFESANAFFEVNIFNLTVLGTVLDLLKSFIVHLKLNKMEIVYFDWPISCIVWNFFDYFNFYEGLGDQKIVFDQTNQGLYSDLIQILEENTEHSIRFSRLLSFLTTVSINSENPMLNNNQNLKSVLMLNLTHLIRLKKLKAPDTNDFINELNFCLRSYDFEQTETCRFILCHMSNLLFFQYKIKKFNGTTMESISSQSYHDTLRLFVNKLLNLDSMCNNKELFCLCLSLIGPIDFQTYHLPINTMEKYEGCLGFAKTYTSLQDYSLNIASERRLFSLQNLASYCNNQMFQFYYFLIENLLDFLNGYSRKASNLAYYLLENIFRSGDINLFLKEYEKNTNQFSDTLEQQIQISEQDGYHGYKNPDLSEDTYTVDCFFEYIKPFIAKKSKEIVLDEPCLLDQNIDFSSLGIWLFDDTKSDYSSWIRTLTRRLISSCAFSDLICKLCSPLFEQNALLCEVGLPYFVENLFQSDKSLQRIIGHQLNKIFDITSAQTNASPSEFSRSIRIYIGLVEFFRRKVVRKTKSCNFWENCQFLASFNYLFVARAAQLCGLHCHSVFFIETWYSQEMSKLKSYHSSVNTDLLSERPHVLELLLNSYKSIGETSALNSNLSYLINDQNRIQFYEERNFGETLYSYDSYLNNLMIKAKATDHSQQEKVAIKHAQIGLLKSLQNNGLDSLLKGFILTNGSGHNHNNNIASFEGQDDFDNQLTDAKFYNSWKLSAWEQDSNSDIQTNSDLLDCASYNKSFYLVLKTLVNLKVDKSPKAAENIVPLIYNCQRILFNELKATSIQSVNLLNPIIGRFYNLDQVQKFTFLITQDSADTTSLSELNQDHAFLADYELQYFSRNKSFSLFDDLFTVKSILIKECLMNKPKIANAMRHHLAFIYNKMIDHCILHKRYQVGQTKINEMKNYTFYPIQCALKESQLLREKCNLHSAKFLIKKSIENFNEELKLECVRHNSNPLYDKRSHVGYLIQSMDLYAQLLNETKSENPTVIIRDLLERSIIIAKEHKLNASQDKMDLIASSFYSLGKFADEKYQSICGHMKSTSFEEHTELMKQFQQERNRVQIVEPNSYFNMILNKQFEQDKEEIRRLLAQRQDYLCKAIEAYLFCLQYGGKSKQKSAENDNIQLDHQNICVFRLISLWTQNCNNIELNEIARERIFKIGTHKFHTLLHQLAARMSLKNSQELASEDANGEAIPNERLFQETLIELIVKIAGDHPYHMLPIILQFSNSHKDELMGSETTRKTASTTRPSRKISKGEEASEDENKFLLAEDRVRTANYVIDMLKCKSERMKSIIETMQIVCDAYIELANTAVSKQKTQDKDKPLPFPKNLLINKIKNFSLVGMLTHHMNVRSSCDYERDLVHIVKIDSTFKLANGINLPKIIMCWGSDGKARKQLVKGRDDLRQDTVMQQFFATVNDLIRSNNKKRNKLSMIRTYKIVPLSQKSGVLEWCENTNTIGNWLTMDDRPGGAHKKYEPSDWTYDECRRKMHEVAQLNKQSTCKSVKQTGANVKHEVFLEVCKNFKPVFRYFFMENYLDVNDWFEKRLNYTRSVATSSIVGYIAGIGDRHVQNILIDLTNADIIHIDFGVAFEQGKILPIPELIPFRLTRDLVDGFGICGTEGIFKNCCESILELLKAARDQISTIFEVLLYDPLHNWCLSPKKAYMLQQVDAVVQPLPQPSCSVAIDQSMNASYLNNNGNDFNLENEMGTSRRNNTNKIAERILYRIKQKLSGYENETQLSCDGHVNFLISEATNTEHLCRIYSGWQPYL